MHFVTGGAFNGKRKWVLNFYQIENDPFFISSNPSSPFPNSTKEYNKDWLIIEGLEKWIKKSILYMEPNLIRKEYQQEVAKWIQWEKEKEGRNLIIIGTDITKGIVPIDTVHRQWRDLVGWIYQDVAKMANRIDLIWYGINQRLK